MWDWSNYQAEEDDDDENKDVYAEMKKKFQAEKAKKKEYSEAKTKELEEMKKRKELNEKKHEETLKILNSLDLKKCVLIRGVSFDTKDETFRPLFEAFGPISQIFLVRNPNVKIAGFG